LRISILVLIIVMLLVGCSANTEEATNPTINETVIQSENNVSNENISTLAGMTAGEFKNQFNATAENRNLNQIVIKELNREFNDDSTMTFTYAFNENINMIMKTDTKLKLNEVFIVSNGDITADSGKDTLAVIASITMTVNPDYGIEDVNELLTRLGWLAEDSDPRAFSGSLDEQGIVYKVKTEGNVLTFDIKVSTSQERKVIDQSNTDQRFNGIITIDEFKANFQKAITDHELTIFNMDNLDIKEEATGVGTFNLRFKDTIALTGTFNEDRKIEIASLLVTGDGTESTGQDIIMTMGLFIMATNPSYSISDAEEVLKDLGMDENNMEKIRNGTSIVRNGVKYSMNFVKDTKVVALMVRNAKD